MDLERLRAVALLACAACAAGTLASACATSAESGRAATDGSDGSEPFGDAGVTACGATPTSVSGVVWTPAKTDADPVYGAVVYVPKGDVAPLPTGLSCDRCGPLPSASAWVSTATGADGAFKLTNVPTGKDVHLVVQVGRWRRQVVLPEVKACQDNPLPADLTRLPRNQKEGDLPRIAIATTQIDPIECVLHKMGVDATEFSTPSGPGRVHVYQTHGELGADGATVGPGTPDAPTLYESLAELERYDTVLLPCEAHEAPKDATALSNLVAYANEGGRVFTTHYSYVWLDRSSPFSSAAEWRHHDPMQEPMPNPSIATIDKSFAKGAALADWLVNVGSSASSGVLAVHEPAHDVDGVVSGVSQQWISTDAPASVQHLTFNTPVGAKPEDACGRVVYSNFHVVHDETQSGAQLFPEECAPGPLTAQEKVLEFMLLDLTSCVQDDRVPPPK